MDNKKIPTHLGTGILVIIAITVGMFVWTYEQQQETIGPDVAMQMTFKKNQKIDTSKETIADTTQQFPEMSQEEKSRLTELTKDWQTYRDEEYGYEFKYPRNYSIIKNKTSPGEKPVVVSSIKKYMPPMAGGCPNPPCNYPHISHEIGIKTLKKPNNISIQEVKKRLEINEWDKSSGRNLFINDKSTFYYRSGVYEDATYIFGSEKTYFLYSDSGWVLSSFKDTFQGISFTFKEL